ncbi:glycosyltransferase family 2 protein [Providencia alcalifaciens]|uniref:glycosyltransferase family 2 protein n=1 Tax=Providencia alcalifaciens TaxID=126385 RepID=UPI003D28E8D0
MKIYIGVISHKHSKLINELKCLEKLCNHFDIIIKSNISGDSFPTMQGTPNFHWINDSYYCGFGHNNNIIYNYCYNNLNMKDEDYFIILNPDVIIDYKTILSLINTMTHNNDSIATINLFKDINNHVYDNSIRKFPSLSDFVQSFLGFNNPSILNKSLLKDPCFVDWAAGSFLVIKGGHYRNLRGFDESYFMYCEDIDICYRSSRYLNTPVKYYPDFHALHLAKHANRKFLSKHFYWHISSVIRFLLTKGGLTKTKSSITNKISF